jgi:hypothetical protein
VPFRERAKSDTAENSQAKPGSCRDGQRNKICKPRFFPHPTENIEQRQSGVKNNKKPICKMKPKHFLKLSEPFNFPEMNRLLDY